MTTMTFEVFPIPRIVFGIGEILSSMEVEDDVASFEGVVECPVNELLDVDAVEFEDST